jgi:hypothetical protein
MPTASTHIPLFCKAISQIRTAFGQTYPQSGPLSHADPVFWIWQNYAFRRLAREQTFLSSAPILTYLIEDMLVATIKVCKPPTRDKTCYR